MCVLSVVSLIHVFFIRQKLTGQFAQLLFELKIQFSKEFANWFLLTFTRFIMQAAEGKILHNRMLLS